MLNYGLILGLRLNISVHLTIVTWLSLWHDSIILPKNKQKNLNTKLSISLLQFQGKKIIKPWQDEIHYTNIQTHFRDAVQYNRPRISETHSERE